MVVSKCTVIRFNVVIVIPIYMLPNDFIRVQLSRKQHCACENTWTKIISSFDEQLKKKGQWETYALFRKSDNLISVVISMGLPQNFACAIRSLSQNVVRNKLQVDLARVSICKGTRRESIETLETNFEYHSCISVGIKVILVSKFVLKTSV